MTWRILDIVEDRREKTFKKDNCIGFSIEPHNRWVNDATGQVVVLPFGETPHHRIGMTFEEH